jgi:hypothetical protein
MLHAARKRFSNVQIPQRAARRLSGCARELPLPRPAPMPRAVHCTPFRACAQQPGQPSPPRPKGTPLPLQSPNHPSAPSRLLCHPHAPLPTPRDLPPAPSSPPLPLLGCCPSSGVQAKNDTELNERSCLIVRPDGTADRVPWRHVRRGDVVRLANHDSPPCDLLVLRVRGGLRAREKELTGESKPVNKQMDESLSDSFSGGGSGGRHRGGMQIETQRGEDAVTLGGSGRVLDASYQLFRGTTVLLSRSGGARPYVEGVAVRLGHECKMYRECRLAAAAPPSVLLERMSSIGMLLVLMLIGFTYDNTLAIFATGAANGASFGKVGWGVGWSGDRGMRYNRVCLVGTVRGRCVPPVSHPRNPNRTRPASLRSRASPPRPHTITQTPPLLRPHVL